MDIEAGSELLELLHALQQDIDGIFGVLHALSDVATEHLGAARPSVRDGEETIWY